MARHHIIPLAALAAFSLTTGVKAAEIDCAVIRAVYTRLIATPAYRIVSTHHVVNRVWEDIYIGNTRYSRRDGPWQKQALDRAERVRQITAPQFSECRDEGPSRQGGESLHAYSLKARLPQMGQQPGMQVKIWLDAPGGRIRRFESRGLKLEYSYDGIAPPI